MICYVDLEHPEHGPSILTEGPHATQRKADTLTFKARFGVQFHPERYSERHPAGRTILSNFFRLAGYPARRSEAAALAGV